MHCSKTANSARLSSLLVLAFTVTLGLGAIPAAQAAGTDAPAQAAAPAAKAGYDQAVTLIQAGKYRQGFDALKALNKSDDANVLNYMGYASRKMGDTRNAAQYYKAALRIAPDHRGALEYYGELMVQQGNAKGARTHLLRLEQICGSCEEYRDLKQAMRQAGIATE